MTITTTTVYRVSALLADLCDAVSHPGARVTLDSLCLDSLDHVELAMEIEEEFGIEVDVDAIDGASTVASIAKMVDDAR